MSHPAHVVLARLAEQHIDAYLVDLGDGATIVVSGLGARVYGPFFGADAAAENWLPDAFADTEAFAALARSDAWNVGGDRWWIGPEIAFMIPDRDDYWGSYTMPPAMDPGVTTVTTAAESIVLDRTMELATHTDPRGSVALTLRQEVRREPHPLRHLRDAAPTPRTRFAGYSQRTTVARTGGDAVLVESWNLAQVRTPGTALIPTTVSPAQVTDYYEPVADKLVHDDRGARVQLTGADRFKIGFSAAQAFGRMGYVRTDDDGLVHLVIRAGAVDPSAEHPEEPDFATVRGDALHLYNDDGGLGGFAELETRGRTFGGANTESTSVDRVTTWWFRGPADEIDSIARQLLGMTTLPTQKDQA